MGSIQSINQITHHTHTISNGIEHTYKRWNFPHLTLNYTSRDCIDGVLIVSETRVSRMPLAQISLRPTRLDDISHLTQLVWGPETSQSVTIKSVCATCDALCSLIPRATPLPGLARLAISPASVRWTNSLEPLTYQTSSSVGVVDTYLTVLT